MSSDVEESFRMLDETSVPDVLAGQEIQNLVIGRKLQGAGIDNQAYEPLGATDVIDPKSAIETAISLRPQPCNN